MYLAQPEIKYLNPQLFSPFTGKFLKASLDISIRCPGEIIMPDPFFPIRHSIGHNAAHIEIHASFLQVRQYMADSHFRALQDFLQLSGRVPKVQNDVHRSDLSRSPGSSSCMIWQSISSKSKNGLLYVDRIKQVTRTSGN